MLVGGLGVKPKIYWYNDDGHGLYICQIPEDQYEADVFTEDEHHVYMACGGGKTMREAYESWLKDLK